MALRRQPVRARAATASEGAAPQTRARLRPRAASALLIALICSTFIPGLKLGGSFSPFRVILPAVACVMLILVLDRPRAPFHLSGLDLSVLLLAVWSCLSILYAADTLLAARQFVDLAACVVAYLSAKEMIPLCGLVESNRWRLLAVVIAFLGALSAIVVDLEALHVIDLTSLSERLAWRAEGLLGEPNFGSVQLDMSLCFGFALLPLAKRKWLAAILLVCLATITGVFFTSSRSGLILIIPCFILILGQRVPGQGSRRPWGVMLLAAAGGLGGVLALWRYCASSIWLGHSFGRLIALATGRAIDVSVLDRLKIWAMVPAYCRDHFATLLVGQGLGSSPHIVSQYIGREMATHSVPVMLLIETGLIGLAMYGALIAAAFLAYRRTARDAALLGYTDAAWFAMICFSGVLVCLLAGLTLQNLTVSKLFWVLLGMISGLQQTVALKRRGPAPERSGAL